MSLLVTGSPQFETQDDQGRGNGVSAIPQWQYEVSTESLPANSLDFSALGIDPILSNTIAKIRSIFVSVHASNSPQILSTTILHDFTCFILHRLLSLRPSTSLASDTGHANISECVGAAMAIYMFIAHGPTYYSHAAILNSLLLQVRYNLEFLSTSGVPEPLILWVLSVGAVAAAGTDEILWFRERVSTLCTKLDLRCWEDFQEYLNRVLEPKPENLFQQLWREIVT